MYQSNQSKSVSKIIKKCFVLLRWNGEDKRIRECIVLRGKGQFILVIFCYIAKNYIKKKLLPVKTLPPSVLGIRFLIVNFSSRTSLIRACVYLQSGTMIKLVY